MRTEPNDSPTEPAARKRWSAGRIVLWILAALVVVFLVIQLVPYGRDHADPPVTTAISWPDAQSESLIRGACYDCHSNETKWPWFTNVAPMSWLAYNDVQEGRAALNFSESGGEMPEPDEMIEAIQEGRMPPPQYKFLHPEARLTAEQRTQVVAAIQQVWGSGQTGG